MNEDVFDEHRRDSGHLDQEQRFASQNFEEFMEQSGAHEWIRAVRSNEGSAVDMAESAHRLGLPVVFGFEDRGEASHLRGMITGVDIANPPGTPVVITVSDAQAHGDMLLTFGHELGHYYLFSKGVPQNKLAEGYDERDEKFCEAFGYSFVLPAEQLEFVEAVDADVILDLTRHYQASAPTVVYQLMAAGKLPRILDVFHESGATFGTSVFHDKATRSRICYDCLMHTEHEPTDSVERLDLTGTDLSFSIAVSHHGVSGLDGIAEINKALGRWSDEDDFRLRVHKERISVAKGSDEEGGEAETDGAEMLLELLDSLEFPNDASVKASSDRVLELLQSEDVDSKAVQAAWRAYADSVEAVVDSAPDEAVSKLQTGAIIHKALIFYVAGNGFRYIEELRDAVVYAENSQMMSVAEILSNDIVKSIELMDGSPEALVLKMQAYLSDEHYEALRESLLDGDDAQDLLGHVYGMLIEDGEDPDEIFAIVNL